MEGATGAVAMRAPRRRKISAERAARARWKRARKRGCWGGGRLRCSEVEQGISAASKGKRWSSNQLGGGGGPGAAAASDASAHASNKRASQPEEPVELLKGGP